MMEENSLRQSLPIIYHLLLTRYGPQHWWPADSPFEVAVGAILTQSASWVNVEKAISRLKAEDALSPAALRQLSLPELGRLIHSSGYYNAKAKKLQAFARWLGERCSDDINHLRSHEPAPLRHELLSLHGIGQETADSILLYALDKPVFVIDAYTRRILHRLGLALASESYATLQALFMDNLPPEARVFNEYHALLVQHGKDTCRKSPLCQGCCLDSSCPRADCC